MLGKGSVKEYRDQGILPHPRVSIGDRVFIGSLTAYCSLFSPRPRFPAIIRRLFPNNVATLLKSPYAESLCYYLQETHDSQRCALHRAVPDMLSQTTKMSCE